jgi:hypothetical protein
MKKKLSADKNLIMQLLGYEGGGELLTQLSPSVLGILSTSLQGINQANASSRAARTAIASKIQPDENPFYALGGKLNKLPGKDHAQGGTNINQNMDPTNMGAVANAEGGELTHKDGDSNYIFSKRLKDPEGKGSFAASAETIGKKYDKPGDDIAGRTAKFELNRLKARNDFAKAQIALKQSQEQDPQFPTEKYAYGGSLNLAYNALSNIANGVSNVPTVSPTSLGPVNSLSMAPTARATTVPLNVFNPSNVPQFGNNGMNTEYLQPQDIQSMNNSTQGLFNQADTAATPQAKRRAINNNHVAIGLKGAALGKAFFDSVQKPEQERLQYNPEEANVKRLMENRRVDLTSILNEIQLKANEAQRNAGNVAGSGITSQVLKQSALSNAARQSQQAALQEQQINNQYRAQEAGVVGRLGSERRGENIRQQTAQAQNDAVSRAFGRQFFSDLSQVGTQFNKKFVTDAKIQEGLSILGMKYADFGVSDDVWEKIKSGNFDFEDWIIFKNAVDQAKNS